jgi:hypothetical protein
MAKFKECELAKMLYDHIYRARRADNPDTAMRILYEAEEKRTQYLVEQKTKKGGRNE